MANGKARNRSKIAGIENFQKMVSNQPDDAILKFIKEMRH